MLKENMPRVNTIFTASMEKASLRIASKIQSPN